jgi:hypothetical protein
MEDNRTVFQRLRDVMGGTKTGSLYNTRKDVSVYNINPTINNDIIYTSANKDDRDRELATLKQQKLLSYQWAKSGYDTSMEQMQGANHVKMMYRDADLMDAWPEIGAALDVLSEEACALNFSGTMLNIYSKSERIKSVLTDLFINKLDIHIMLPMVARAMCKYGNEFMLLNLDMTDGVIGWRELPVYDIRRIENGLQGVNGAMSGNYQGTLNTMRPDEVRFIWEGHTEATNGYQWYQVAHFRMINDSLFLPYGTSHLNKARRAWRMMSMMEDAMLLHRLDKSVERRIFKVNVGAIDDADVPAFLNDFMNSVKRAPIIDPKTGQVDLRKNFLDISADYVIPIRSGADPSDITTLQSAQHSTSMDDITYIENKVLSALKVPKSYLNFQDKESKGQNLSSIDIRFSRVVNRIQQALLLELNKIAIIHLYLLGFEDDLTNFNLSLNNPSKQLEILEMENLTKNIAAATSALNEQGCGIPLMSWRRTQKDIMGRTDGEIFEMINEIRLEKAMAEELVNTPQIIKKTGMFNNVDRIYGEPGAEYTSNENQGDGMEGGPMGGGPMGGFDAGGLGDLGEPGGMEEGEIGGDEGTTPMDENMPMESVINNKNTINEKSAFNNYLNYLKGFKEKESDNEKIELLKNTIITETFKHDINTLQ